MAANRWARRMKEETENEQCNCDRDSLVLRPEEPLHRSHQARRGLVDWLGCGSGWRQLPGQDPCRSRSQLARHAQRGAGDEPPGRPCAGRRVDGGGTHPDVKRRELIRHLRTNGCVFIREGVTTPGGATRLPTNAPPSHATPKSTNSSREKSAGTWVSVTHESRVMPYSAGCCEITHTRQLAIA
jgi:hypothetical protein